MAEQPLQGPKSRSWHVIVDGNGEYLPPVTNVYANNTVEVVPRSEAEALAEALESMDAHYSGSLDFQPGYVRRGRSALEDYRSRHPKETT